MVPEMGIVRTRYIIHTKRLPMRVHRRGIQVSVRHILNEWLDEYTNDQHDVRISKVHHKESMHEFNVHFDDEKDAIRFLIRWSNWIEPSILTEHYMDYSLD